MASWGKDVIVYMVVASNVHTADILEIHGPDFFSAFLRGS